MPMPAPMTEATKPPPHMTGCVCEQGGARFTEFESRDAGRDETEGRFADVTLNRCRTCGRTWLRYLVEYEAFSRSGRCASREGDHAAGYGDDRACRQAPGLHTDRIPDLENGIAE